MTLKNTNRNKSAIVFGGSGDLGKEISKDLHDKGFNIVISHNKKNPNLDNDPNTKNKIYFKKCNFLSETSVKNFINYSVKKIGVPSLVINTVGIFDYENIKKINYNNIITVFKINSLAILTINKELLKKNKKKTQIKIISIGSSSSLDGFKDTFSYCGSKHALLGIIKSLNKSISNKKIFNYCLNVGSIKNTMGRKVRSNEFQNFIDQNTIVKTIEYINNTNLPAFPEEIFLKRLR